MARKLQALALAVFMLLGNGMGIAQAASEVDILLDKLVEKGILSGVEAGLIRREIEETKEARNKELAKEIVPSSARNWNWKGDIRLRDEIRNREGGGGQGDYHRQRIRFRYGVEGKVSDDLKANFRIATGSTADPVSTNQSFNTGFNKVAVNLDLANLEYSPEIPGITSTKIIGGVMENPQWVVGPMVWDGDLSVSGGALKLTKEMGPVTLFSNNGIFILDTEETEASSLWFTQGGVELKPMAESEEEFLKEFKIKGALAYQDYKNTYTSSTNKAGTDPLTRESQNTSRASDFNQLNPTLEVSTKLVGIPMSVYGDWVHNASADSANNNGFQFGLKAGKAANKFLTFADGFNVNWKDGWEGGYYYQQLESNAVYDEYADSDFNDGGTNNKGHVWYLTFATLKNSTLGAKYFRARQLTGSKDVEDRLQLDWVTKF